MGGVSRPLSLPRSAYWHHPQVGCLLVVAQVTSRPPAKSTPFPWVSRRPGEDSRSGDFGHMSILKPGTGVWERWLVSQTWVTWPPKQGRRVTESGERTSADAWGDPSSPKWGRLLPSPPPPSREMPVGPRDYSPSRQRGLDSPQGPPCPWHLRTSVGLSGVGVWEGRGQGAWQGLRQE